MQIGRKDVIWNYAATTMRVASGIIVLPIVLRMLPSEEVGLWNIFLTIGSLATLLDFGFFNSFTRNITYVFSGVKELKEEGYVVVKNNDTSVDYGLLKSVIAAMRRFYGVLTGLFLLVFIIASPFYLTNILHNYSGNTKEVWIAWFTYGVLVAYQLYTYYYSALLSGRGYIKRVQQITIIGQTSRIVVTLICLFAGLKLMSLVIGQFVSDIVNRMLCYYTFYDKEIKQKMRNVIIIPVRSIMKKMTPNAVRIGITTIGAFLIGKAIILIIPFYMSLSDVASYGLTKQMIDLIIALGGIWFATFYPKITLHRVNEEMDHVKRMYIKGKLCLIAIFLICGVGLMVVGDPLLTLIHSKTHLLPVSMIFVFLVISFLDANHGISTSYLLTKNEVPFMKATIVSGIVTLTLLYLGFKFLSLGLWGMILAPGIAQALYQNWKWPLMVKYELKIKVIDYWTILLMTFKLK
jgi:O-antigen/teichoic acid export membrane protein